MSFGPDAEETAKQRVRRKLAAILAADVAGYTRLSELDEEGTAKMLLAHRDVMDTLIRHYEGRIANTAGDSVIAEFGSSVEAVRCALDIQEAVRTNNLAISQERQVQFRIGINVGDVIRQGDDLMGDGVNLAARLESLAKPGGICLSGEVHDQIQGKLSLDFQSIKTDRLKNVSRILRAYAVRHPEDMPESKLAYRNWVWTLGGGALAMCIVGLVVVFRTDNLNVQGAVGIDQNLLSDARINTGSGEVVAFGTWQGTTYQAVLTWGGDWYAASADAESRGGTLVSIGSEGENDYVYGLIRDEPRLWVKYSDGQTFGPWIGLYQEAGAAEPDGGWAWTDGSAVTYLNFSDGQPNNYGGKSDVVTFHNYVHQPAPFWDDANASGSKNGYIMEMKNQ